MGPVQTVSQGLTVLKVGRRPPLGKVFSFLTQGVPLCVLGEVPELSSKAQAGFLSMFCSSLCAYRSESVIMCVSYPVSCGHALPGRLPEVVRQIEGMFSQLLQVFKAYLCLHM